MKKSTPVIMGVLLILGIVALGYFADLENPSNNTTNNTTKFSILKANNFTDQTQDSPQNQAQTSDTSSNSGNPQNTTTNATSGNITATYPG